MERISVSEWGRFLLDLEEYQQRIIGCARGVEATTKSLKRVLPAPLLLVLLLPLVDARSERATRRAFCRNISP
jgi:hypothetical protein